MNLICRLKIMCNNENRVGFSEEEHKVAVQKSQEVAKQMKALHNEKKDSMTTIRLGNDTIVSSTSPERLQDYIEDYNKRMKFRLYEA